MSQLRSALRAADQDQRLVTRGYVLRAKPEEVDTSCIAALLARGREALASGDPPGAADHLRAASLVLATLQQNLAGVYVRSAVPNVAGSSFTVNLSEAVTASALVAWFVVN